MLKATRRYHSKFGGMWIDAEDWQVEWAKRIQTHELSEEIGIAMKKFVEDGFVILERAADQHCISQFEQDISAAFRRGHENLLCQLPGDYANRPVTAGMERHGVRIVDAYATLSSALELLSSPKLLDFLYAIFSEPPLLFQSLSFDTGSGQGLHQIGRAHV